MNFEYKNYTISKGFNDAQSFLVSNKKEVIGKVCYREIEGGIFLEYIISKYPNIHNGTKMILDLLELFGKIEGLSITESKGFWDKMGVKWKENYSHGCNQFTLTL